MRDLRYAFNLSEDEDARPFSEVQMQVPFGSAQGRLSIPLKSASLRMDNPFFIAQIRMFFGCRPESECPGPSPDGPGLCFD
jgi:hypothetical protein